MRHVKDDMNMGSIIVSKKERSLLVTFQVPAVFHLV
jgi:hypothetical protein